MGNPVTLNDAIDLGIEGRLVNVHTALPGAIISYDFNLQKASIQPLLNKAWADGTSTPMPVLENVPVMFPSGGGGGITFPVVEGDTCLLIFNERSTDKWLTEGGQVTPDDNRKFDLSDAVAIVGFNPFTKTSTADNNTDVLLTYKGSKIRIKQTGAIVIETASTIAIGTQTIELLQTLITLLNSFTAFTGSAPYPTVAAAAVVAKANLTAIQGTIP
jgi:hypothetical protein